MPTTKPAIITVAEHLAFRLDETVFAALYYMALVFLVMTCVGVSAWGLLGVLLLWLGNGIRHSLGALLLHMQGTATLPQKEIEWRTTRPHSIQFFIQALATGWLLHMGVTYHPALLIAGVAGVFSIVCLSVLRAFVDECVRRVP